MRTAALQGKLASFKTSPGGMVAQLYEVFESVLGPGRGARLVGQSINAQGNELALRQGRHARRRDKGLRSAGTGSPADATGVNPLPSITGDLYLPRS
jgi:hypothetical protein